MSDDSDGSSGSLGRQILGWVLVVAGLAALVLPGPGLLLLAAGLTLLASSYEWARRWSEPVRKKAKKAAKASVQSWRTISMGVVVAVAVMVVGVVWGLRPPAPGFWPLPEKWWLPGGWGTGSSLIGSGCIGIGLLVYSYRKYRR